MTLSGLVIALLRLRIRNVLVRRIRHPVQHRGLCVVEILQQLEVFSEAEQQSEREDTAESIEHQYGFSTNRSHYDPGSPPQGTAP